MHLFTKILVANRGEIAVRIIRACKEMGIQTVAVFSEADKDALHVHLADESLCIGPAAAKDSYLNMTSILAAAVYSKAQAIHPGYGFLSENANFAELCRKCNITFIGPEAKVIAAMGNKDHARKIMTEAGVPIIPGTTVLENIADAKRKAEELGYPVVIKACSGGGGRGMRIVKSQDCLEKSFYAAANEAQMTFGDGSIYIEKHISPVRHIEIQLLCDNFCNVVCLGERDCSIQRRNQKLLEESPSPAVDDATRNRLMEIAKNAAKAINYTNSGTVEFLMDKEKNIYFIEMNTRLQVEYPVTEMRTGIDMVKWQIRIAAGVQLPFGQKDIKLEGHSMECRINAENPEYNFRPSCGKISLLHIPGGPGVRFDTALYQDYYVPHHYDSMVGKMIVHASNREEAIRKMQAALAELVIEGIDHNGSFHMDILSDENFKEGVYSTDFLEEKVMNK